MTSSRVGDGDAEVSRFELSVSGDGEYEWDGRGPSGNLLPPGAYLFVAEVVADARTDRRQRVISLAY